MTCGPNPACQRFGKNTLLEHSHTLSFMNCSDCLPATMKREFSSWDRDHMTCKVKNIYYLTLYQNHLPIPALSYDPICVFTKGALWGKRHINGYACMGIDNFWGQTNKNKPQPTMVISGSGNELRAEEVRPMEFPSTL